MQIGKQIKHYRIQKGLRQEELCQGICSISQLSKIETGKVQAKSEQLHEFAKRLGMTVAELESESTEPLEILNMMTYAKQAVELAQFDSALTWCKKAMLKSEALGNWTLYARAVLFEIFVYLRNESPELVLERSKMIFQGSFELEPPEWAMFYSYLAAAYKHLGEHSKLLEYEVLSLEYLEQTPLDHEEAANAYDSLADAHYDLRNPRELILHAMVTMNLYEKQGSIRGVNRSRNNMAQGLILMGRYEEAKVIFEQSYRDSMANLQIWSSAAATHCLGTIALLTGDLAQARTHFEQALNFFDISTYKFVRIEPRLELATVSIREHKFAQGERKLQEIEEMLPDIPGAKYLYQARIARTRAESCGLQGQSEEQLAHLRHALDIYERHTVWYEAYEVATELAELLEAHREATALDYYRSAIQYHDSFEIACGRKILEHQ